MHVSTFYILSTAINVKAVLDALKVAERNADVRHREAEEKAQLRHQELLKAIENSNFSGSARQNPQHHRLLEKSPREVLQEELPLLTREQVIELNRKLIADEDDSISMYLVSRNESTGCTILFIKLPNALLPPNLLDHQLIFHPHFLHALSFFSIKCSVPWQSVKRERETSKWQNAFCLGWSFIGSSLCKSTMLD
jgi:hypothetical protein